MTSAFTPRTRLNKQGTGDNTNAWGDVLNSGVIDLIDFAMDGWTTKAITGDVTLTSANGTTDEARAAVLKFTGSVAATVTIPAVEKTYYVWNASTAAITLACAGGGTTLLLNAGDVQFVICDAVNVKAIGFAGVGLKAYIDSAILATTGSLPATTGNDGKTLIVTAGAWTPTPFSATANIVRTGTSTTAALTPGDTYAALPEVTITYAASVAPDMSSFINAKITLTGNLTLANPTNIKPGQSGRIRLAQDGTGSRLLSAVGSYWKRSGGLPVLSTTASQTDTLYYDVVDATTIYYDIRKNPT